jgi:multiple sugar transport system permease protein
MSTAPARTIPEPAAARRRRGRFWDREAPLAYLFLVPGAVLLLLFMAYPFGLGIYLSLTDKMVGFADFDFIGLDNYRLLLNDPMFRRTVQNTFVYSFVTVPFKLFLGLGLALVLNQRFRFSRWARAGLLLPWIVPTAISSLAWLMLFDSVLSPISWTLKRWGLIQQNVNFLGDAVNAMASLCVANIWRGIPFFAISILAGLQAVAPELTEAAALDGAGPLERFRSVTLPTIRPIVLITTLFSIIWTFSDFQLIYVLTKGGPAGATHVFGT